LNRRPAERSARPKAAVRPAFGAPRPDINAFGDARRSSVTVVDAIDGIEHHREAIEDLAKQAAHPNPFYEPWCFLPLLKAFPRKRRLRFLFVRGTNDNGSGAPDTLIGLFPFEQTFLHPLCPVRCLQPWQDAYRWTLRRTPLLRAGAVGNSLAALGQWLAARRHAPKILLLEDLPGGSEIARAVECWLTDDQRLFHVHEARESHLYRRQTDAETYLSRVLSGRRRRHLRRLRRLLEDLGPVRVADIDACDNIDRLLDEFISLELSQWKGRVGTSMASMPDGAAIAKSILREAHRRKRLSLLALRVGDRLVAARSAFLAPPGCFGFKMAYDENPAYARCGPGFLLDLEGIYRLHDDTDRLGAGIAWLDSCAVETAALPLSMRTEPLQLSRYIVGVRGGVGEVVARRLTWAMQALPWRIRKLSAF
jgi:hypothetical protein